MLIVGLTGGIGSGKSFIANIFAELRVEQVDADIIAREVVQAGEDSLRAIKSQFAEHPTIILDDGNLNRPLLREIIFTDPQAKKWIEDLLHPIIRKKISATLESFTGPYALLVSPLLLETNQHELVDRILVVDCPVELQIQRVAARDDTSEAQTRKIIASQISRSERIAAASDIIDNSGSSEQTRQRVLTLHELYLTIAN